MKFNEWLTQKSPDNFKELTSNGLGMEQKEDPSLIESQLEQWVDKLNGLLYNLPSETRVKLVEKVIEKLKYQVG